MQFGRPFWLTGLILAVLLQVGLLSSTLPLGIPNEWVWSRVPAGSTIGFGVLVNLLCLGCYLAFVWGGSRFVPLASRRERLGWLAGLLILGCLSMWTMRGQSVGVYGHAGLPWVTYYPRMSGYFTQAAQHEGTLQELLAGYEQTVREGDYLHQGTHPPGLPIYFYAWLQVCEQFPQLRDLLLASQPMAISDGIDVIEEYGGGRLAGFRAEYRAVLWGNVLLTHLLVALTVVPLFLLTRHFRGGYVAWWLAGLWPLCPGVLVFLPKSDVLFPVLSAWTVCLYVWGGSAPRAWQRGVWAALAGAVLWIGLMFSLALLVVGVILALWTLLESWQRAAPPTDSTTAGKPARNVWLSSWISTLSRPWWRSLSWEMVAGGLAGILLPSLLVWWWFDLNLANVWSINLAKHGEFYEHNTRTYLAWLLVNPLELIFSLGAPVSLLLIIPIVRLGRLQSGDPFDRLALAVLITWALLWVSGKNMGEAARLWIFLFPLLMLASVSGLSSSQQHDQQIFAEPDTIPPPMQGSPTALQAENIPWVFLGAAQAVVTAVTVATIDGFDYAWFLQRPG